MAESVKPVGDRVVRLVPRTEFQGSDGYREVVADANEFVGDHGCESVAIFVIGADGETLMNYASADRATALGMLFKLLHDMAGVTE